MASASSDALIQKLDAQVRAEVASILAAANEEVRRIEEESHARRNAATGAALQSCGDEVAAEHARRLAEARSAARRALLESQHATVARVLAEVPRIAGKLGAGIGDAEFAERIANVLGFAGDELEEIRCAPAVFQRLAAAMETVAGVRVCPDPSISAGVRAVARGGTLVVDDTLESWLTQERPRLTIEICRAIAAGGSG